MSHDYELPGKTERYEGGVGSHFDELVETFYDLYREWHKSYNEPEYRQRLDRHAYHFSLLAYSKTGITADILFSIALAWKLINAEDDNQKSHFNHLLNCQIRTASGQLSSWVDALATIRYYWGSDIAIRLATVLDERKNHAFSQCDLMGLIGAPNAFNSKVK